MYRRIKVRKNRGARWIKVNTIGIVFISVFTAYCVVVSCHFPLEYKLQPRFQENLLVSVDRLADAFDLYNHKRFIK